MQVTFRANARVLNYLPGRIYTVELDPVLKALLDNDVHLSLIDPPTLDPRPTPTPAPASPKAKDESIALNSNSN